MDVEENHVVAEAAIERDAKKWAIENERTLEIAKDGVAELGFGEICGVDDLQCGWRGGKDALDGAAVIGGAEDGAESGMAGDEFLKCRCEFVERHAGAGFGGKGHVECG